MNELDDPNPVPPPRDGESAAQPSKDEIPELPLNPTWGELVESLLKSPAEVFERLLTERPRIVGLLVAISFVGHTAYGLILGAFSGYEQLWAAPIKFTFGSFAAAALCLPSLYVLTCMSGIGLRVNQVVSILAGIYAMTSLLLLAFAPVAFVFTYSVNAVGWMGFFHLGIWGISIGIGLNFLFAGMLRTRSLRSNLLHAWAVILIVTLLQMSATLRPLIGRADTYFAPERRFFVEHWWQTSLGKIGEELREDD